MTLTDKEVTAISLKFSGVHNFARAIIAARDEELRKQKPVATVWSAFSSIKVNLRIDGDLPIGTKLYAAPIPPTEVEPATEYAEYILDHYDRKSRKDRKLLGKHLAEWADRRYRNAAPIPPDEPRLKRASLMAFGVISEIRKLVGNGKVQFVADLGGSIWTWPDAADSAITELRSVCFDAAHIPTPSQEEANREASLYRWWKKNREVTLITAIYGNGCVNKTLADVEAFILARPDTEGSGK